jgi:restriction system protein
MSIPKFPDFLGVVLQSLADKEAHSIQTGNKPIKDYVIQAFSLTESDLKEMVPSGQQLVYYNRITWAITYLRKAGLVENVSRGIIKITELGLSELKNIHKFNVNYFRKFTAFREFAAKDVDDVERTKGENSESENVDSPEINLSNAYESLNHALISDLKEEVMKLSPDQFERLVIKLLLKMGYGSSVDNAGTQTRLTNDGGIDGIIKEDQLGFSNIYIQAKQWQPDSKIGRPEIQKFSGALLGEKAQKGLFITTAMFTNDAKEYAKNLHQATIVLVDGNQMMQLMIKYNLGVSIVNTYEVKRIDSDFFSEDI